jgi:DNA-directed RNA polymerase subunit N (RpoN/RPB10)
MEEVSNIYNVNFKYSDFFNKFIDGRIIIKKITEEYSNPICNLTSEDFNSSILDNLGINRLYEIIYENLSNGTVFSFGQNITNNYIEFRRVCYYDGSLYLVEVLIS